MPPLQSASTKQGASGRHFNAQGPPQSLLGSPPFWTPSKHVGAAHTALPAGPLQTRLSQSALTRHGFPGGHPAGHTEPQSVPASAPFWMPSSHAGGAHTPAVHKVASQSAFVTQPAPS